MMLRHVPLMMSCQLRLCCHCCCPHGKKKRSLPKQSLHSVNSVAAEPAKVQGLGAAALAALVRSYNLLKLSTSCTCTLLKPCLVGGNRQLCTHFGVDIFVAEGNKKKRILKIDLLVELCQHRNA